MSSSATPLVLATDLDGTMAHGDPEVRARLVGLLHGEPRATLIYVTGRTPVAALELTKRTDLPVPDVLIADVGTSVLHGMGPDRLDEVEAELEREWPGADAVRARLNTLDGRLAPQEIDAPRRVSYWIEPVRRLSGGGSADDAFAARAPSDPTLSEEAADLARDVADEVVRRLDGMDVDVLVSANVFLDVLPRGVNKGSTLRRVLRWLNADEANCVVAGDSLNDLGLFETGLRGIAVGNCEPELRRRVQRMDRVYTADAEGAAGVLEGLRHHGHFREAGKGGASG